MTSATRRLRAAALVAAAAFVGTSCSSDSPTAPDPRPAGLAQIFDEMALPGLGALRTMAPGASPLTMGPFPGACAYAVTSQRFECGAVAFGGLTATRSYTLLDASGAPLSRFDPGTVDAVRVQGSVVGSPSHAGMPTYAGTTTIEERSDLTLSGLLTSTHTLNGVVTSRTTTTGTSSGAAAQTFRMAATTTIADLVLPAGTAAAGRAAWPLSGTVTSESTIDYSGGGTPGIPPMTTRVVTVFNGTSRVAVTMTTVGMTQQCTIDLASPTFTGC